MEYLNEDAKKKKKETGQIAGGDDQIATSAKLLDIMQELRIQCWSNYR